MDPSRQLARFVQELRTQHHLGKAVAGYFRLDNGDELHLLPEALRVRLRYYEMQPDGMLVKALEVISFVDHRGVWYPFEFTRTTTDRHVYGRLDEADARLTIMDTINQRALADYCDAWAFRLREQGWLTAMRVSPPTTMSFADEKMGWPEPTEPEPDLETIEAWFIEDGGCEATDGCWVEMDGRCPHGYPSWLLQLGLI